MQGTCQADKHNVYSGAGCEMCPGVKESGEIWMTTCGIGYQDRSCSLCSDGYFFTFGRCYSCPGGGADFAFTIGVVIFMVALWIFINTEVCVFCVSICPDLILLTDMWAMRRLQMLLTALILFYFSCVRPSIDVVLCRG